MNASAWDNRLASLRWWHQRLRGVQIDCTCALAAIRYWDGPDVTFYVDPPYWSGSRRGGKYKHEASDDHHRELVETLLATRGRVVLSGYDTPLYDPLLDAGWQTRTFSAYMSAANGATKSSRDRRTERLWIKELPS